MEKNQVMGIAADLSNPPTHSALNAPFDLLSKLVILSEAVLQAERRISASLAWRVSQPYDYQTNNPH
jgi:hypothetical protein